MFHMLCCFNLKPGVTIDTFEQSLALLDQHLKDIDLLHSTNRIGRRNHHPVMDTDSERDHEYFMIMKFRDRAQCDRSVQHIQSGEEPGTTMHRKVWQQVSEVVSICWEDI